jgi:hypothetical protein
MCVIDEVREGNLYFIVWGVENQITHSYVGCYGPSIVLFCTNVWPSGKVQESHVEVLWCLFLLR